jgi:NADPH:quinone reductase-like Zn-dependent oxidoreductase
MTTQTVKIVRFHQIGAPEVLQLDELPLPEPGGGEFVFALKLSALIALFEVVANPDEFPEEFLKAKPYVFDNLAKGTFKPRISKTFPLSQIVDAHRYMESNAQVGKIVVTV